MGLSDKTISEFTSELASRAAVPGGGGASALVGALGAALGSMVGGLTVGKKKYAAVEDEIKALTEKAQELQKELLELIDRDAQAFEPLSKAYSIPKDRPDRDEVMERCLRDACSVPLDIMRLSCRAIDLQKEFAEKGSVLAISDAATGAVFCRAALCGGAVNVRVNTHLMKDREYADRINAEADEMMNKYREIAADTYDGVMERLK